MKYIPDLMKSSSQLRKWADSIAYQLDDPAVLVTPEVNSILRDWDDPQFKTKFCFLLPVQYSAIISNLGIQILYEEGNRREDGIIIERSYFPERKQLRRMEKARIPLFSKETFHKVRDFDIIGFSLFYPVQFLNVPVMLDMAGIPRRPSERTAEDPIVLMGGICGFNPEPVAELFDAIFIGEGEGYFIQSIRVYEEELEKAGSKADLDKDRVLYRWATEIPGWYIPHYYSVKYHQGYGVKDMRSIREGIPDVVTKAVAPISQIEPPTYIMIPVIQGGEMSVGSVEIGRGCSNFCTFCEGTFRTIPYRERGFEMAKKAFTDLIKNTGVKAVTPYAFNLSDYGPINKLTLFLLEDQDRKISMSSQRIDMFSYEFASIAHMSGNRSITLAVEAGSQHMRDRVSKNLTVEQILRAFKSAFKIGFSKIKVYNIANLPLETRDDIENEMDSHIFLVREIAKLRDKYNPKCKVVWSFTPFQAKNVTPMQWVDSGSVEKERTMNKLVEVCRELRIRFRIGTSSDVSTIAQVLTMGDRRLLPVIERAMDTGLLKYFGGMSIGKGVVDSFQQMLHEHTGHDYRTYYAEKPYDTIFPWDFIDLGLRKAYMLRMWKNYKEAKTTPSCFQGCRACGGCDLTPGYNVATFKKKQQEKDVSLGEAGHVVAYARKPNVAKYAMRIRVEERLRFLDRSKVRFALRRAFYRTGFPARDKLELLTDKIRFQNWTYGSDYAFGFMFDKIFDVKPWANRLNAELDGITVETVQVFTNVMGASKNYFEYVAYNIQTDFTSLKVQDAIAKIVNSDELIVKLKKPGMDRGSWESVPTDVKPWIGEFWYEMKPQGAVLRMTLKEAITPYEILPLAFKTTKRNILRFPIDRLEFLKKAGEHEVDMFVSDCINCGAPIERNIFDVSISDEHCLRCLPFDSELRQIAAIDEFDDAHEVGEDATVDEFMEMDEDAVLAGTDASRLRRDKFEDKWTVQ